MIIPQHIKAMIQRIKHEVNKEYAIMYNAQFKSFMQEICTKETRLLIIEKLCNSNDINYIMAFETLNDILCFSEKILQSSTLEKIFCEIQIDSELVHVLNLAESRRKNEDAKKIILAIQSSPNWGKYNKNAILLSFHLVESYRKWHNIIKNTECIDLSKNFRSIKICLKISETHLSDYIKYLNCKNMDEFLEKFSHLQNPIEKWFRIGKICDYYIYVTRK